MKKVASKFAKNNLKMTQNADNICSTRVFSILFWFAHFADRNMAVSESRKTLRLTPTSP